MRRILPLLVGSALLFSLACNPPAANPKDYSKFRQADPKSILVVPVVNRTVDVTASDYFLSTISRPVAERGYYVYPVYVVKRLLEDDGLSDANLVHQADPKRLGALFGADSILYIIIDKWDAKYAFISTTVEVEFRYSMKSGKTGEEIWSSKEYLNYTPQNQSSGSPLGALIGAAISAAVTKAAPNYIPLAQQANGKAVTQVHQGLPSGPYLETYKKDLADF